MDITREILNTNPREHANPLAILFFSYTYKIFIKGYTKTLDVDDLYNPLNADRSSLLGNRLEVKWKAHLEKVKKSNGKPSLLRVIAQTFWPEYLISGVILTAIELVFRIIQPLMLGELLDYFRPGTTKSQNDAFLYAGAVVALNGAIALLTNQYVLGAFHYGMKVRAACCTVIYRKALSLSRTALGESASGKVVNLLSNDVSRFDIFSYLIHYMWIGPASSIIIGYFLYSKAGYAGLIGMIPIFAVVPMQGYIGKLSSKFRRQTAYKTDERIRLMDEIISGVQVIKMYAWEKPFTKIIKIARQLELRKVLKLSYVRGIYMTFNLFTTRAALFSSLLTIALTDQEQLTAANVFVFMSYFNILSNTMSSMFVRGISEIAEALVAVTRLQAFLLYDEFRGINAITNNDPNVAVRLNKVTTKWNEDGEENALYDMNIVVPNGTLLGVIGPVGSGKSSFLQTLLGELRVTSGIIEVNGSVSYASQEPWVFSATLRQNIIFGQEFDKRRYNEVIRVCALEKDFKQFPSGDLSLVGERGASLSGGQKARINLARAVYRKADIYLLDDPLSAVDVPVGKHLYHRCINGFLSNKTRILVTHQVHHLKNANNIIILNNGSIEIQGTFHELSNSENYYAKSLAHEPENNEEKLKLESYKRTREVSIGSRQESITSSKSELNLIDGSNLDLDTVEEEVTVKGMQEESSKGKVGGSLFFKYLLAGGSYFFVGFVLMLYLLSQTAASMVDYFVSYWVKEEEAYRNGEYTNGSTSFPRETYIYVYSGLLGALFVIALTRALLFYYLAMKSSQDLHNRMFNSIVNASMYFFNTNPSGRILNRFAKDIGSLDEALPKSILDGSQIILLMVGSLVLVAIIKPFLLIPVAIIGVIFIFLRVVYLKSSKNIKRLEGMTRSPVFTHLNATLQGLTTIRAYGAENILKQEFDKHQDLHSSAWFMFICTSCAFGFFLDLLCFFFTVIVTFSFVLFKDSNGADVGLAITQASALTGMVQWGVRQSAEVANNLMSVERILEYTQLPAETQPKIPKTPSISWPEFGKICFKNVGLKYSESSEMILKDLNVTIESEEKVGIVGRTGAGKSSLISALFRLAIIEGEIEIDDINTKDLSLQILRSKISIIPQDPVLFSGTLRYNLDPFEEYADDVLYRALDEVELKDPANLINKLEYRVLDRGSNYSVGQRQLICLARALVRNNKILMLDEATANVDPQTDALIQKTIREKFAKCTVLTVAHRLNTIMDSDKVLVMDYGRIVDFDHPYLLLQNQNSVFYKMVTDTGSSMMEQLIAVAKSSYEEKHGTVQ